MRLKRTMAFTMVLLFLFSMLPLGGALAAEENPDMRNVYLHAQGDNPAETVMESTVYMGENFNLYVAVDDPNKGAYVDGVHTEPQYDLNGYTVKLYYDPTFFSFAGKDAAHPIDYTVPDKNMPEQGNENEGAGGDKKVDPPEEVGYFVYDHGAGTAVKNGKSYQTAYITVFFSGAYLPQEVTPENWYNLCALPLRPLRTGSSDVFMEVDSDDKYTLELFAKDVNEEYPPTFQFTTENGGYHHIEIREQIKPAPPMASPMAGSYTEKQEVTLTAEDGCEIYYSVDGGAFQPYTEPIPVDKNTEIKCYAVRKSDEKQSNTVTYLYEIIPDSPYLFVDEGKTRIDNIHRENAPFTVWVSDKEIYGNIEDVNQVYYTFSDFPAENIVPGNDPETGWVQVDKRQPVIAINQKRTVRLITDQMGQYSDVAWYYLGIRPAPVTASQPSGYYQGKIDVTLSTTTPDAEIYYTLDGSDPRENGVLYSGDPLTLYRDANIRAVAKYDGEYSNVESFWYVFSQVDAYGVDAFYPSGVYEGEVHVTLMPENPDNTLEYSTDGGETWLPYKEPLTFDKDTEVRARATDSNWKQGDEYIFTYKVRPLPPVFVPESTQFTNANQITIYAPESTNENTEHYALLYTTDGSDPTTSPTAQRADGASDTAVVMISRYTVVSAVVVKDGSTYSSIVAHSYDIVTSRPVSPIPVLTPGNYTERNGSVEEYDTPFMPVPAGTTIYYTVSYGDGICPDPIPGAEGTILYDGTPVELKGRTVIKAVAVNAFGIRSDVGIFEYVITPEAPEAAPGATVTGDTLPVVPVEGIPGSELHYSINGEENTFTVPESGRFYLDTRTGNAYKDPECTELLGVEHEGEITAPAEVDLSAKMDGVESGTNHYRYNLSDEPGTFAPPYADKKTGTYEEINVDGENSLLIVGLASLNRGENVEIQYRTDNEGEWYTYDGNPLKLKEDTLLQLRATDGTNYSSVESYVYEFVPLPPVIVLPSGRYVAKPKPTTTIEIDSRAPTDRNYTIWYRANGDRSDVRYMDQEREIDHTMSLKAYVSEEATGKRSANTIHYYIIESAATSGSVYTAYPYEVYSGASRRISAERLSTSPYNEGIRLLTQNKNAQIHYYYVYTALDGTTYRTESLTYDNAMPIPANSSMKDLTITAWLTENGNEILDSQAVFNYEFVTLAVPLTSLAATSEQTEFASGTTYTLLNEYADEEHISIYYTQDGSDPSDPTNPSRKLYENEELKITQNVTVKTVYYSPCGSCVNCKDERFLECTNAVYGPVGSYRYTVPTVQRVGGGGGGGSRLPSGNTTEDTSRKYTKDIFGNEHPTHIGYIKGYPDGSVQPDGSITREECAVVLYRIKNKEYEAPSVITGSIFPDVTAGRWSAGEIEYMANDGVLMGYPDGTYQPERNLSRAEFAALISRFAKLKYEDTENVFPDLEETHWAYRDILALYASGLLTGYPDGTYRPEATITRAEVMTVMNKILGRNPSESYVRGLAYNPYNDLSEDQWHYVIVLEATVTHDYFLDKEGVEIRWEDVK